MVTVTETRKGKLKDSKYFKAVKESPPYRWPYPVSYKLWHIPSNSFVTDKLKSIAMANEIAVELEKNGDWNFADPNEYFEHVDTSKMQEIKRKYEPEFVGGRKDKEWKYTKLTEPEVAIPKAPITPEVTKEGKLGFREWQRKYGKNISEELDEKAWRRYYFKEEVPVARPTPEAGMPTRGIPTVRLGVGITQEQQVEYTKRMKSFLDKADIEIKKVNDDFMAGKMTLAENQAQRDAINLKLDKQANKIRKEMGFPEAILPKAEAGMPVTRKRLALPGIKPTKPLPYKEYAELKQTPRGRAQDLTRLHSIVIKPGSTRTKAWAKDPGSADIIGIDTPITKRPPRLSGGRVRITPKTPRLRR